MKLVYGAIGAAVGGAIGAAIWALIAYYLKVEIAWLAIGVGALCGLGMALCVRDEGGLLSGAVAAVIAVVAICGGKYMAVEMILRDAAKSFQGENAPRVTAESAQLYMAEQLVEEAKAADRKIQWPGGKEPEEGINTPADAPPAIWKDVQARWSAMDQAAQDEYMAAIQRQIDQLLTASMDAAREEGFLASFELLDIVFFVAAIYAAFKCGSSLLDGKEP